MYVALPRLPPDLSRRTRSADRARRGAELLHGQRGSGYDALDLEFREPFERNCDVTPKEAAKDGAPAVPALLP